MRIIIIISFILLGCLGVGLAQDNPFDVYRQDTVRVDVQGRIYQKVDHLKNPYDVEHIPYVSDNNISRALKPEYQKKVDHVSPVKTLPFWVIVVSVILLAIIININRSTFINVFKSVANDNFMKLVKREENSGNTPFFYLLYLLFCMNLALFIWLMMDKWGYTMFNLQYGYILGGIVGIYLVRHISLFGLGQIFPLHKEASYYSFQIVLLNGILGLILLIINVFVEYSPMSNVLIYVGMGIILVLYLLRSLKGISVLMGNSKIGLFHFFTYLCTSEIAPNLVIWSYLCNNTIF